jgi:NAD(P)-dependent dehydrogenase (short-subunit alcohol dehydrogenase family)
MATPTITSTTPRGLVLVTGGSGYVAGYCIVQLLNDGWRVRTTVRNFGRADEVRATIGKITSNPSAIEFKAATPKSRWANDLNSDVGWADAVAGADYMLHVASPVPIVDPKSDDELVRPVRDGTLRVLKSWDWRGLTTVQVSASKLGLHPLNLIVWAKTNAGMGGLYRSQHEFLPMFKVGSAANVNNIELGKRGRWRSNVWTYPGASSFGSDAQKGLKDHPTVKPTIMLKDALLESTCTTVCSCRRCGTLHSAARS